MLLGRFCLFLSTRFILKFSLLLWPRGRVITAGVLRALSFLQFLQAFALLADVPSSISSLFAKAEHVLRVGRFFLCVIG